MEDFSSSSSSDEDEITKNPWADVLDDDNKKDKKDD